MMKTPKVDELTASSIGRIEGEQFFIEEEPERPPQRGLSQLDLEQLDEEQKDYPPLTEPELFKPITDASIHKT